MKLSPAVAASVMAYLLSCATAFPTTTTESDQINFYQASGMTEMQDGTYTLTYDSNGDPKITFTPSDKVMSIGRAFNTTSSPRTLFDRAEGCDNFKLNPRDTDLANADLQAACGDGYKGTIWSRSGNTVAFYCQYESSPWCRASESRKANGWITKKCGAYWAGSYESAKREYAYGYTDPTRHNFCGIWL